MFDQSLIKSLKKKKVKIQPMYLISNAHHVEKTILEVSDTSGGVTLVGEDG